MNVLCGNQDSKEKMNVHTSVYVQHGLHTGDRPLIIPKDIVFKSPTHMLGHPAHRGLMYQLSLVQNYSVTTS